MGLATDVAAAIDENLTAEVGERLKRLLSKAECDAETLDVVNKELKTAEKRIEHLKYLDNEKDKIMAQRDAIADRQVQLNLDRAVLNAHIQASKLRTDDIFRLAEIVFDNPKMKFRGDFTIPGTQDSYGRPSHVEGGEETKRG